LPAPSQLRRPGWGSVLLAFKVPAFRASAFGYFGHMWELYAFWTVVPMLLASIVANTQVPFWSFTIIGTGAIGCVLGGMMSARLGGARIAALALIGSGAMCALSPWLGSASVPVALAMLLFWGLTVPADSPQFSALSAQACPPELIGSALALQNSIGFLITVVAIAIVAPVVATQGSLIGLILLPGPVLGLVAIAPLALGRIRMPPR
ncbi:MAG: MFS transporter, partial [Quisquiliibacterium sp.]